MGIGEVSKDNINVPKESSIQAVRGEKEMAMPLARREALDTIEKIRGGEEAAQRRIPESPDKPLIEEPRMAKVLRESQVEESVSQNSWLASGSQMSDFFIISGELARLLGKMRIEDDSYRLKAREGQYDYSMLSAEKKKDMKLNEATQEFVKSMSSGLQSGLSGIATVQTISTPGLAQKQFKDDLAKEMKAIDDHKATLTTPTDKNKIDPNSTIGKELIDKYAPKVDGKSPWKEMQNESLATNEAHAAVIHEKNLVSKEANDKLLEKLLADPPADMKTDNAYKKYKEKLDSLEKGVESMRANEYNIVQGKITQIETKKRFEKETYENAFRAAEQGITGSLNIKFASDQFEAQETDAQNEVIRDYKDGAAKAVQSDLDFFNEILRNNVSMYKDLVHSSYKS